MLMLDQALCDYMQAYTQFGGLRPFGVSFLFAGYDRYAGWQLFQSDPSGNYAAWKATAIGANNQAAMSILKQDYSPEIDLNGAKKLAVKVLLRTMDSTSLTSDKLEVAVLENEPSFPSSVSYRILSEDELQPFCDEASRSAQEAQS